MDEPHTVEYNQPFDLVLGENPSTGFSWDIQFPSSFSRLNEIFRPYQPVRPGLGGYTTYTLLPRARGMYTVYATYRQPWEASTATHYEIVFNVV